MFTEGEVKGASLSDIRVLDLTRVWAGPLATRIFGDFGAEVIKISDPRVRINTSSGTNNKLNRNKRSMALRLDISAGREIFMELVTISDVVIENFRPRVMRNFDLSYANIRRANPNIVMCSMPGYGTEGPYSEYPAFGTTAEAFAGIPSLIGYGDSMPMPTGLAYADPVSGLNAVSAILVCLRKRNIGGGGQLIDIALAASPVCTIGEYFVANSAIKFTPSITGNRKPDQIPHRAYQAKGDDDWVVICVTNDEEWRWLCNVLGDQRLSDISMLTLPQRKLNERYIDDLISEWTGIHDAVGIMEILQKAGVPAGRVANNRQLLGDVHLNDRQFFVQLEEHQYGLKKYEGQSIPGNYVEKTSWQPSGQLGEDNRYVLVNLLGHTDEECDQLIAEGAVPFVDFLPLDYEKE